MDRLNRSFRQILKLHPVYFHNSSITELKIHHCQLEIDPASITGMKKPKIASQVKLSTRLEVS